MIINYYSACTLKFNYQKKACHIPINHGAGDVLTWRRGPEHALAQGQSGQCGRIAHSFTVACFLSPRVVPNSKWEAFWELMRSLCYHSLSWKYVLCPNPGTGIAFINQVTQIKIMAAGKATEHSVIRFKKRSTLPAPLDSPTHWAERWEWNSQVQKPGSQEWFKPQASGPGHNNMWSWK